MSLKVTYTDTGWSDFMAELGRLNSAGLQVGIPDDDVHPSGKRTTEIAAWNEFGTPEAAKPIPARPAFTTTLEANKGRYGRSMGRMVQGALGGYRDIENSLEEIGSIIKQDLKEAIQDWYEPPNAAFTVKNKGENNPLVETEHLQEAITVSVENAAKTAPKGRGSRLRDPLTGRFI